MASEKILMDPRQAGAYLRIAPQTLARWRTEGDGPPFLKLGGRVRYERSDLDAWLEKQRRRSTADDGGDNRAA